MSCVSSKRPTSVKISQRNSTFLEKENEATVNNPNNLTSIKSEYICNHAEKK